MTKNRSGQADRLQLHLLLTGQKFLTKKDGQDLEGPRGKKIGTAKAHLEQKREEIRAFATILSSTTTRRGPRLQQGRSSRDTTSRSCRSARQVREESRSKKFEIPDLAISRAYGIGMRRRRNFVKFVNDTLLRWRRTARRKDLREGFGPRRTARSCGNFKITADKRVSSRLRVARPMNYDFDWRSHLREVLRMIVPAYVTLKLSTVSIALSFLLASSSR